MRSVYDALLAGPTPVPAPAELYGLVVGPDPVRRADWLATVVDADRILTVGRELPGVECLDEPRDRGTLPSTVVGLLHVLALDPDALVVVLHGEQTPRAAWLPALVQALAAVVEAPGQLVALAAPQGEGAWLYTHPGRVPDRWGVRPALTYRAAHATPPPDALRDAGVLVGEAKTLLRRLRAASPAWTLALSDAIWQPEAQERLYRSLPTTSLEQALERDAEGLWVAPVDAPTARRPQRRLWRGAREVA